MLIVVNAMFPMFSFCKLLYLYMFRCGAREAVRGVSCFPADRADLHRCRSGAACFPTDRADCTDAVRGGLIPQIAPGAADATDAVRVLLVFPQIAQICTDAVRGASCFPHRLRRWRQGASVSFVTMLHVTCYNKVVPYCAGWALRNYIVYILYI